MAIETSSGTVNIGGNYTQTTYKTQIQTGTNKFISFTNATHNDLSNEGSAIVFSRQSDGSKKLSGIFGHSNSSLGLASRGDITFHAGGTSTYDAAPERLRISSDGKVGINEASNINAKLHIQHDALNENILYATRYNDQANDKPIFAVTEATMDGFVDSGLVIGSHNRSMRLGAVFDNNAGVTTSTAGGITINTSATGASSTINNIGINTGRPANALVVKHSEPTIRLVNTSQPNAIESGRIRFTEYDTDYQGGYIHYNGLANLFYIGVHNNVDAVTANDNNVITIERTTGITTFKSNVAVYGSKFKLPVGTSNPSSPLTGDAYYNTAAGLFKIYDGSSWGSVLFAAAGTQQNPATSASNLGATGAIATYYFSPDGGTAFQHQAAGGVANFGTIPSGGPSWVYSHNSCILIDKLQIGQTTQYKLSQTNFLKFIAESITRTGNTPYIYWAVFDTGTLWGIWRIRWTGATYSSWVSGHDYNGTNTPPSGTPSSDVWKTGSGSTGNTLATGSYTVSNENNLVRAVLPSQAYQSGTAYGIHYKRYDDGEHYPWRNSAGNCTSNGYFRPSGTYSMGTDSRYVHYIYLSDS